MKILSLLAKLFFFRSKARKARAQKLHAKKVRARKRRLVNFVLFVLGAVLLSRKLLKEHAEKNRHLFYGSRY